MKVSYKWLQTFLDLKDVSPLEVADKLTFAGVEVEEVKPLAAATGLCIGQIISCEKHPNSDHLHLLRVDLGAKHGIRRIVCGAPNARSGLKVIVALPGAKLPNGTIESGTIRGEVSEGMCCSLLELGVERKYLDEKEISGIHELEEDAPIGEENVLAYLGLDDVILDLKLLANRPDLNAMENVALEVGALYEKEVKLPSFAPLEESKSSFVLASKTPKCSQFLGLKATNVKVKESPQWLKERLLSSGIRSINNIVDIGNYVMLLTGQPLNMYDASSLAEEKLVANESRGEEFLAMDEKTYHLIPGDLVIYSGDEALCLAGIMTSKKASVNEKTKSLIVEAASFNGASIRRTSSRLGLNSESSARFIKGVSEAAPVRALEATVALLKELAEPEEIEILKPYCAVSKKEETIVFTSKEINERLGTSFEDDVIVSTLKRDHLMISERKDGLYEAHVPSYRLDLHIPADLSEEVIRLLGYENVPLRLPDISMTKDNGLTEFQKKKRLIRTFLRNRGFDETLTYSLVAKENAKRFAYLDEGEPLTLNNPLTVERSSYRESLVPSLLESLSYNHKRQMDNLRFFECGEVHHQGYDGERLAVVVSGKKLEQDELHARPFDFYDIKGIFQSLMGLLGIKEGRYRLAPLPASILHDDLHPYQNLGIYLGKKLEGYMGLLHPHALKEYELTSTTLVMELDLRAFLELPIGTPKAPRFSKFPFVSRDLAIVVDEEVEVSTIINSLRKQLHNLASVSLFDLYRDQSLGQNKKSLALNFLFQSDDRTLSEEEVNKEIEKALEILRSDFQAEVRG